MRPYQRERAFVVSPAVTSSNIREGGGRLSTPWDAPLPSDFAPFLFLRLAAAPATKKIKGSRHIVRFYRLPDKLLRGMVIDFRAG